ncbi:MAG: hypothetical protein HY907_15385 [Deltaproteobacteria bacterium]|nr:hypothetical protein [Deltaproteobacteria bacterium]
MRSRIEIRGGWFDRAVGWLTEVGVASTEAAAILVALVLAGCSATTANAGVQGQESSAPVQYVLARPVTVETLHPDFETGSYSPRIECAVKEGGLQVEYWDPVLVAVTVNRSPSAGYCDIIMEFDLTDHRDQTQTHQIMRRTVWFEIGEEARLSFSLPSRYGVNNARVHTE